MRAGDPAPLVGIPSSRVVVNGLAREAVRVSTVREIGGAGVPGMKRPASAEGDVEWATLLDASDAPAPSPWTRAQNWPPAPGSPVTVDVGHTGQEFRMLSGVVDRSSAGSDGYATSSIIDPVDRLHRRVTVPPLLAKMPPLESGGAPRHVGLSSDYVVDRVLRECGYYPTPYIGDSVAGVSVPAQGSLLPVRGEVVSAGARSDGSAPPSIQAAEWGYGIYDGAATYTPQGVFRVRDQAEIGAMVSSFHAGAARVSINVGSHRFDLLVNSDRSVAARYYDGSSYTTVALPATSAEWVRVSASFGASTMTIATSDGRSQSAAHGASSTVTGGVVDSVYIGAEPGSRIGGINAGGLGNYLAQPLNASMLGWGVLDSRLTASPAITGRDALDVIGEIADATCRAYWWDEDGTLNWMPGDILLARQPRHELTSLDSLVDLGWSESITDTHRRVVVERDVAAINFRTTPSATVWQGGGDTMASNEVTEEIVTPPPDEDWVGVDTQPVRSHANHDLINRATRSVVGGIRTDGTSWRWGNVDGMLTVNFSTITQTAWKITHTTTTLPPGQSMQLSFPDRDATTTLWQRWRDEKLPLIRAYAKVSWAPDSVTAGAGPVTSGDYVHDGGRWLRGYMESTPQAMANFLASWLCVPRAVAEGVRVVHDPRVQVGDVVTVRDEHAHGVVLTALVTRLAQTTTPSDQDMELDLFIIDGAPSDYTLGQHTTAQSNATLGGHTSGQGSSTLAAHTATPDH